MAASQRQYTTVFAIGAKILGSFKGVMRFAEQRMKALHAAAQRVGAGFKKLTGLMATFTAGFAGFKIGEIFSDMFSGAAEAAADVHKQLLRIQVTLLQNAEINAGGMDKAKKQAELIKANNDLLGKQGVLSKRVFYAMSSQLALKGMPTAQIIQSSKAMGDLLVATRGVNANEADMVELASAVMRAVKTGKSKQLAAFGIFLPKGWEKQFVTYQARLEDLYKRMAYAKDQNYLQSLTDLGRIQMFQNHLADLKDEIGDEIIPVQAQMADMWDKALADPKNKKAILDAFKALLWVMNKVAEFVVKVLIPAFNQWRDWWEHQSPAQQRAFQILAIGIIGLTAAVAAFNVVFGATGVLLLANPITWIVIGVLALIAALVLVIVYWKEFTTGIWVMWKAATRIPIVGQFIQMMGDQLAFCRDTLSFLWHLIWDNKEKIINVFKDIGKVIMDWMLQPFRDIHEAYDKLINLWKNRPKWLGGGGGAAGSGANAVSQAAYAAGQAAMPSHPLDAAGQAAVRAERANAIADLQRPEIRNLVSATLANEARGVEDQKNVLESLVNRYVAYQNAGTPKTMEQLIKGGFYGPYNRGETAAVMAKGLSDARSQQVAGMIQEIAGTYGAPRNVLGGLTDQGMANEVHGSIKEHLGEDWYSQLGIPGEQNTAAFRLSRYANGGIVNAARAAMVGEGGPEAIIPLSGGSRAQGLLSYAARKLGMGGGVSTHHNNVHFAPNITINGNATESEQRAMDSRLRDLASDFISQFAAAQRQERRLSYEGSYG